MHLHMSGSSGSPAVLFLHAVGASGWMWDAAAAALHGYQRIVPDLPGHGRSADLPWRSMDHTLDGLADAIAAEVPSGRAHLVGLSLGGYLALSLARRHPDRVDRVVVSGVNVLPFPNPGAMRAVGALTAPIMKWDPVIGLQARALRIPADKRAAHRAAAKAMSREAFLRIGEELLTYGTSDFEGARAPTLVLAGEREPPLIRRSVPLIVDRLPGAMGRLAPGMGHGWIGEAPELFKAAVESWLAGRAPPQGLLEA